MEEIQSTYYGAYYEPLKELEQEVLGWLSELVDGLSNRQGERPVEHIRRDGSGGYIGYYRIPSGDPFCWRCV